QRSEKSRRKLAAWTISLLCIGILIVTGSAAAERCPRLLRVTLFGVGVVILLCSIIVLACIKQDDTRHTFGHSGASFYSGVSSLADIISKVERIKKILI
ncbi:cationic amino acid transporter 4 vacuolar-like, partial [Trifolium medium]|nr:cationic amino acid transporter 4 vacuolar-like [Trifolium medium]